MNDRLESEAVEVLRVRRNDGGHPVETRNYDQPFSPLSGYGAGYGAKDGIPLRNYWRSVRKRLWLVLGIAVLVSMLTIVYLSRQPDIYEAQARVQVDLENNISALGSKNTPVVVNNSMSDVTYFNTQLENLSSSSLLRRVVKTLDLEHNADFLNSKSGRGPVWGSVTRIFRLGKGERVNTQINEPTTEARVEPPSSREDLAEAMRLQPFVQAIQDNLTVKQVNATRLIKVTYHHHDPLTTAKVVNTLMDIFVLSNLEMKTEATSSTGDFLQRRIAELQSQIRSGEEQLLNYAKNNQILTLDENQN